MAIAMCHHTWAAKGLKVGRGAANRAGGEALRLRVAPRAVALRQSRFLRVRAAGIPEDLPQFRPKKPKKPTVDTSSIPDADTVPKPTPGAGPTTIVRINPDTFAAGGVKVASQPKAGIQGFSDSLAKQFIPMDLDYPGVHVINLDPPILSVQNFVAPEVCEALVQAANISGKMARSKVNQADPNTPQDMRTSSSLAINAEILGAQPKLKENLNEILSRVEKLFTINNWDRSAMKGFTKPTEPGLFTFELPQIARYRAGEHFLAHEDAFPITDARSKGFQRRATVLVYLNDVAEGGKTKFDIIGIAATPKKGDALIFFPSFQNGMPDHRTLHTAEDAVEGQEKWVSQTWVSWGLDENATPAGGAVALTSVVSDSVAGPGINTNPLKKGKKKRGSKGFGDAKGFGAKPSKGFGSK